MAIIIRQYFRGNIKFTYLLTYIFKGARAIINKRTSYKTLSLGLGAK